MILMKSTFKVITEIKNISTISRQIVKFFRIEINKNCDTKWFILFIRLFYQTISECNGQTVMPVYT